MKNKILSIHGTWRQIADSARTTVNKDAGEGEPSSAWKRRMLLSEHSPIRKLKISSKWSDLKSWVSIHFVRHKFGIEHFVSTQRSDRTGEDRDSIRQDAFVEHEFEANAQAVINISRKRLCKQASQETQDAWIKFLDNIKELEPELYSVCVPDCVYRGWCYEFKSCGFHNTQKYKDDLEKYRENVNK